MAGTITHRWDGTTLIVTSDSGTSSANLKGDTGIRGSQGVPGVPWSDEKINNLIEETITETVPGAVDEAMLAIQTEVADTMEAFREELTNAMETLREDVLEDAIELAYPVGSIYLSINSTSPASLFGGTWTQLKDRFLLGAGGSYDIEATGGETTHKLTMTEMPSHGGHLYQNTGIPHGAGNATGKYMAYSAFATYGDVSRGWNNNDGEMLPAAKSLGGNTAHNNMPPYLAVYMWKRTA